MSKTSLGWIVLIAAPCAFSQQPQATGTGTSVTPIATPARRDSVHRVDPGQMYHRVYARVPLVGTGKAGDPVRPMFAPIPASTPAKLSGPVRNTHSGILGYTMLTSDDGKWALCEFVGATPKDLAVITSAASSTVVVFERGKNTVAEIETDFQQYMKTFTFASFAPFTTRVQ